MTHLDRFYKHVRVGAADECWEWIGARNGDGYGKFQITSQRSEGAHRAIWTMINGPVPQGMVVKHTCDNRACVNLAHLELGTQSENVMDSVLAGTHFQASKTHCKRGHEFTPENTILQPGGRKCRECANASRRVRNF